MSVINYINASLEIWGCVMSAVVALCLFLSKRPRDMCSRLYMQMLVFNVGSLLFDMLALFFRGHPGTFYWFGVRAANFIAFSCNYLLMVSFVRYLTEYLGRRANVSQTPLRISRTVCILSLGMVVLTQFFPIFYTIDAQNVYHRAELFWLSHAMGIVCLFLCAWLLMRYRNVLERQEKACLWSYILLPLAALLVQMFFYGLVLLNLVNTVSLVVIFLFLQAEQGRRMAEVENDLTQSRVSIMLSQIQPHFIYNTLGTIEQLCLEQPHTASKLVHDFSLYLRGSFGELDSAAPIRLSQEIEHIRHYVDIEMLRFPDMEVRFCLNSEDFLLPALSVQPLVENAIKHGLMGLEQGGTVIVSTDETGSAYRVTVTDNGVGFDPAALDNERRHIGIRNIRGRLEAICGGTLRVESSIGKGTTATITIPKKGGGRHARNHR